MNTLSNTTIDNQDICTNIYCYVVNSEIKIHFMRLNKKMSNFIKIYFTNHLNEIINIPNISVIKWFCQNNDEIEIYPYDHKYFLVSKTDNLRIKFNDKEILCIESRIEWNIKGIMYKKPRLTSQQQFQNLMEHLGLIESDFPVVYRFPVWNEVSSEIRQRKDTNDYIMITTESSWRDDTDDHFKWNVVVLDNEKLKEYEKYKVM